MVSSGIPTVDLSPFFKEGDEKVKINAMKTIGHACSAKQAKVSQEKLEDLRSKKDREWMSVTPMEDTLVVNVGDIIQVLSNDKFKSAIHRVVRQKGRHRHSLDFFYNIGGDHKWVEPLPQFTKETKEALPSTEDLFTKSIYS